MSDPQKVLHETVPQIVPGRPDREVAAAIRQLIDAALRGLCRHMDAAREDGFEVNFQIGEQAGKRVVTMLTVAKHF